MRLQALLLAIVLPACGDPAESAKDAEGSQKNPEVEAAESLLQELEAAVTASCSCEFNCSREDALRPGPLPDVPPKCHRDFYLCASEASALYGEKVRERAPTEELAERFSAQNERAIGCSTAADKRVKAHLAEHRSPPPAPAAEDADDAPPLDPHPACKGEAPSDSGVETSGFGGRGDRKSAAQPKDPKVQGALHPSIVQRVVRAHMKDVQDCYNRALACDAGIKADVTIDYVITSTGQVGSASVKEADDEWIANCVSTAAKRWKFPKPNPAGNVIVSHPFTFRPK